jgi:Flp pilus assembly protein TadG
MQRLRSFHAADGGQNLVEFALLLPILMYILMGIMQFGLIFAVYLTLNNAVREGARWASIYVYDNSLSETANDDARDNGLLDRLVSARGILSMDRAANTPNFTVNGTTWTGSTTNTTCPVPTGTTFYKLYTNGDTLVCYVYGTEGVNNPRKGYFMYVESYYHLKVFMPLLQPFLPDDPSINPATGTARSAPWIRLPGRITVVIN